MDAAFDTFIRLLIASPFLASAAAKSVRPSAALVEIGGLASRNSMAIPLKPALIGVLAVQWLGGLAMLATQTAPFGAFLLMAFLVPVTLMAHAFWTFPPHERPLKRDHFFGNVAIFGGLLLVAVRTW